MNRLTRHIIATVTSALVGVSSLTIAFVVGIYAVKHGIPWGFAASFIFAIVVLESVTVYVVKKLLVDYW
jgi:hypothetical protein